MICLEPAIKHSMKRRILRYFPIFVLLLSVVFGSFHALTIPSAAFGFRSVPTETSRIALTFDDGPHPKLTPRILDILDCYHVRATFFMIGVNVENYPNAAREVAARGHEIGNHTFSHHRLRGIGEERAKTELTACADAIERVCGQRPRLFRPPEGSLDSGLVEIVCRNGYETILWSLDTRDWDVKDENAIVRRVLSAVKPGDIILMHDFIGYHSKTPEALEILIPKLQALGYEFVTVGELLGIG